MPHLSQAASITQLAVAREENAAKRMQCPRTCIIQPLVRMGNEPAHVSRLSTQSVP